MIAPSPGLRAALAIGLAIGLVATLPGCAGRGHRSPEALREAYAAALERDDPDAAYALLAPEVQARMSREQFTARWRDQAADREAAAADLAALPADLRAPLARGTTIHSNGAVLQWTVAGDDYLVVSGLPALADRATPAEAIRAFIAAVRGADLAALEAVLADELRARIADEWEARVSAIEARLEEPGAIELSPDSRQARLRYDKGRSIALEQHPDGWKITSFQ